MERLWGKLNKPRKKKDLEIRVMQYVRVSREQQKQKKEIRKWVKASWDMMKDETVFLFFFCNVII